MELSITPAPGNRQHAADCEQQQRMQCTAAAIIATTAVVTINAAATTAGEVLGAREGFYFTPVEPLRCPESSNAIQRAICTLREKIPICRKFGIAQNWV